MGLNTTAATWVSGATVTAAQMNTEVRDAVNGIQAAWTAWTPTVASGLTVGNGTWTGAYLQVGKDIKARFTFTMGTTSSVTGQVLLLFPVAVSTSYLAVENCGSGCAFDSSAGTVGKLVANPFVNSTASSGVGSFGFAAAGGQVVAAVPFTWATGDVLSGTLLYEAA